MTQDPACPRGAMSDHVPFFDAIYTDGSYGQRSARPDPWNRDTARWATPAHWDQRTSQHVHRVRRISGPDVGERAPPAVQRKAACGGFTKGAPISDANEQLADLCNG
jgi:hypothetical protein